MRVAFVILFYLIVFQSFADNHIWEGKVVAVGDGDSVKVLQGKQTVKIRLSYIDAPEIGQPYGKNSKKALSNKVFGKMVKVESLDKDQYGRIVAVLYLAGHNINLEMVKEGHAWVYRYHTKDAKYYRAEKVARHQRLGIWRLPQKDRVAPWTWRKNNRDRRK